MSRRRNANHRATVCVCPLCKADMDTATRISDALNMYIHGLRNHLWDLKSKWMAFRLSDGTSDGVLYDSKRDAIRHQANEFQCTYVCFVNILGGARPAEVLRFLNFTRDAYDAGYRLPDPDDVHGGKDVVPTAARMDCARGEVVAVIAPELQKMMERMEKAGLN